MQVLVNKKPLTIAKGSKLIDLLEELEFTRSVAVFVNDDQLLLADYDTFELEENDEIRIIKPLGGG